MFNIYCFPVGFGMNEIIYQWTQKGNAVTVAKDVELPQFRVLGYRKKTRIESLTTGKVASSFSHLCRCPPTHCKKTLSIELMFRQLFPLERRVQIHPLHGLLSDPDLHSVWADCHHIMGFILAQSSCNSRSGSTRRDDRFNNDDAHVVYQRGFTQSFLHQVH